MTRAKSAVPPDDNVAEAPTAGVPAENPGTSTDLTAGGNSPPAAALTLTVIGPAKGRWRAGRHFGPEAVAIPVADLTEDQIAAIQADPELSAFVA